jgi:hypothetical protein
MVCLRNIGVDTLNKGDTEDDDDDDDDDNKIIIIIILTALVTSCRTCLLKYATAGKVVG